MNTDSEAGNPVSQETIFDNTEPDVPADSHQSTDEQDNTDSDSDGGEDKRPLEINEEPKPVSKADIAVSKQVDAWALKVATGEANLDDLANNENLSWLYLPVKQKLGTTTADVDIEAVLEKKLKEREEKTEFTKLKTQLNSTVLSNAAKMEIEQEFKALQAEGLSAFKALNIAVKAAGVKFDTTSDELKKKMALPKSGNYRTEEMPDDVEKIMQISDSKKRLEALEKLRTRQ